MSAGGSYDPKQIEPEIRAFWDAGDYFHAEPDPEREPYSIVIPPPNVTGALHLGHALNNTLQDILIRTKRMQGYNACWLPGTDHAGIATQAMVEKRLREDEGKTRHEVGRDGLVERIWAWKEDYGNRILNQLRLMGCSCDWQRTRFTLDEMCARAVYETFFRLFKDGLIFRGKRLVNWDTQLQTAVADDEVYHETVKSHLWNVRYPVVSSHEATEPRSDAGEGAGSGEQGAGPGTEPRPSGSGRADGTALSHDEIAAAIARASADGAQLGRDYLMVATTRPETMLADVAVAVHPNDERYKHLIGTHVLLPLMNRPIPVIADGVLVDPEFGTGAVKVTPGHDPNDYECGLRHDLPQLSMMTPDGKVSEIGRSHEATEPRSHEGEGPRGQGAEGAHGEGEAPAEPNRSEPRPSGSGQVATAPRGGRRPIGASDETGKSTADLRPPGAAAATGGAGILPAYDYVGLSMDAARKQMVADLEAAGLMDRIEPYETDVGHSDRSKTPIQPFLSEQWFVKMGKLAELAMEAVRDERVQFFPPRFAKSYLDWLGEKRDWCISRQLWWGHRIPVLELQADEGKGAEARAALTDYLVSCGGEPDDVAIELLAHDRLRFCLRTSLLERAFTAFLEYAEGQMPERVERGAELKSAPSDVIGFPEARGSADRLFMVHRFTNRDPDVLDTWFSSALWPFSTFGWPGERATDSDQSRDREGAVSSSSRPLPDGRGSDRTDDGSAGASPSRPSAPGPLDPSAPAEQGSRDHGAEGPSPASASSSAPRPLDPSAPSDLSYFYPTNVLSTARDIISLWVARMVMTSEYLNGRAPFQHVLIHPTILDGRGKRMSKTAGNGLDPLDLIEHYGSDAMRYSLAALAGDTQDVRIPVEYLCPHCQGLTPQKPKHLGKPIVACDQCQKEFASRIAGPELMEQYGLGLSLSERFEDGKRFANKLWQVATGFVVPQIRHEGTEARRHTGEAAGRAAQGAEAGPAPRPSGSGLKTAVLWGDDLALEDRWILSRLTACIEEVNRRRDRYQFSDMINALYSFFWGDFCDWYVELVKPRLYSEGPRGPGTEGPAGEGEALAEPLGAGGSAGASPSHVAADVPARRIAPADVESADTARRVLVHVLDSTLRLLHPVMPFITERLWHLMNEKGSGHGAQGAGDALCVATWPSAAAFPRDPAVEEEIQHTLDVIRVLRDIRAQVNAMRSQAKEKALRTLPRALVRAEGDVATQLRSHLPMLIRLGQCDAIEIDAHAQKPPKSASKVLHGVEIYVPLDGLADPSIETGRLEKERDQLLKHLKGLDGKLANEKFVNNAAADVVQRERDRHAQLKSKLDAVQRNLADLG